MLFNFWAAFGFDVCCGCTFARLFLIVIILIVFLVVLCVITLVQWWTSWF